MDYEKIAQEMLDLGQYDEAVKILNQAIEHQPRKDEYYYLRGEAKHCLEEYEDAWHVFQMLPFKIASSAMDSIAHFIDELY